ncbi:MAG: hypothetical protein IT162_15080, partial [Bryobacterales bacterium]|nr:hypothetical protein [Bryobacterales bacterium]
MKRVLRHLIAAALLATAAQAQSKAPAAAPAPAKAVPAGLRCIGKTSDGDQCKRKATDGKKFCWQHDPTRKKAAKKAS